MFFAQMVSLLMVGVAAWGKWFGLVSSFRVMAAVIAVGLFLFLVAIVGLCGAVKHHQVLLFFVSLRMTHFLLQMYRFCLYCICKHINALIDHSGCNVWNTFFVEMHLNIQSYCLKLPQKTFLWLKALGTNYGP